MADLKHLQRVLRGEASPVEVSFTAHTPRNERGSLEAAAERARRSELMHRCSDMASDPHPVAAEECKRPAESSRGLASQAVDAFLRTVARKIECPNLATTFVTCLTYTLDHTVRILNTSPDRPDAYVSTGDIDAMWLRDSTQQLLPYLRFVCPSTSPHGEGFDSETDIEHPNHDYTLHLLFQGTIRRQAAFISTCPYANAFYPPGNSERRSPWAETDYPTPPSGVHEMKWELDSVCAFIELLVGYSRWARDASLLNDHVVRRALGQICRVLVEQQRFKGHGSYQFRRRSDWGPDGVFENGYGRPYRATGAVFSTFRPSDDATLFGFNTPQNLYAAAVLTSLIAFVENLPSGYDMRIERPRELSRVLETASALVSEILDAVASHGIGTHPRAGLILAYEFDGFGNKLHMLSTLRKVYMDDPNTPSLLSMLGPPYASVLERAFQTALDKVDEQQSEASKIAVEKVFRNTRRFVWSEDNPTFIQNGRESHRRIAGLGSDHTLLTSRRLWPLSIINFGLTSESSKEQLDCIRQTLRLSNGRHVMPESVCIDKFDDYTREGFAWANAAFAELVIRVYRASPDALTSLRMDGPTGE